MAGPRVGAMRTSGRLRIGAFLAIAGASAVACAALIAVLGVDLRSPGATAVVGLLYMPSPLVAAAVVRRLSRTPGLPRVPWRVRGAALWRAVLLSGAAVAALSVLLLLVLAVGGALSLPGAGHIAGSEAEVREGAAELIGSEQARELRLGPVPLLLAVGLVGAVVAAFSVNGIFALGEEWGWRGFLLPELEALGVRRLDLAIGVPWGLWHAPLIVLGFNYSDHAVAGVGMMVIVAIAMSRLLRIVVEATGTVLSAAVVHGGFNAFGSTMAFLVVDRNQLVGSVVGVLGVVAIVLAGEVVRQLSARWR